MWNVNDILAQMAAGKSIEQIAQEAADALNAAKAEHEKREAERIQKEREAAAARALEEQKRQEKVEAASNIIRAIFAYTDKFYPGFITEDNKKILLNEHEILSVVEELDAAFKDLTEASTIVEKGDIDTFIKKLDDIAAGRDDGQKYEWSATVNNPKDIKRVEAAIDKFLQNQGLK